MYRFQVTITPEIYADFNVYTTTKSVYGKELIRKSRLTFSAVTAALILFILAGNGWTADAFIGFVPTLIVWAVLVMFWPRFLAGSSKAMIKGMSKKGKAGYDPHAEFVFYDEHFEEVTPDQRTSTAYTKIDRAVVCYGKVIYLYMDRMRGYILPATAFESPQQMTEFVQFLRTKIVNVEEVAEK